ncbi:hypothetical protein [Demequina lutea]|uniref:Uncharacterized protein n=1 Tax=Demequina lutea TaxID=431489 RepID=A0A7Y9ZBF6_9MICO|nr:hypothetical protein [Demequina lutea]NYI42274.1 hypothetical protein [Demequina lutea]
MTSQPTLWLVAVVGGLVSGFLGIHGLGFLGWAIMLVWLVVTIALGLAVGTKNSKALRLGTYGFVTGFSFMCFGYEGAASLPSRFAPFGIIGLFCAVCAIAVGAFVHLVTHRRARL